MKFYPLCCSFIHQSVKTWEILKISEESEISISEESITDLILLELYLSNRFKIQSKKFTKKQESNIGADWEWWLGSKGNWLGLRIQAKKLYSNLEYGALKDNDQIDKLIEEAENNNPPMIPIYVFYNYWNTIKHAIEWQCDINPSCFDFLGNENLLGCGLSHANSVQDQINSSAFKKIGDMIKIMYPWSCLFCCCFNSEKDWDLPKNALNFIKNNFSDKFQKEYPEERFIVKQPPNYVYKIIEGVPFSKDDLKLLECKNVDKVTVVRL